MKTITRTLDPVTEVAYWEHRHPTNSDAPTLILIHGLGLTSQVWVPLIELLQPSYSILAVDVPGYGESPRGSGELTIDSVAQRIADLADSKQATNIVLIGHSMGGFIALNLATRLAGSLKRVILLDSTLWRAYRFIRAPIKLALRYPRILVSLGAAAFGALLPYMPPFARFLGRTSFGRQVSLWPFVYRPRHLRPDLAVSIFEDMRTGQPILTLRRATRSFELATLLARIAAPITVVSGANDGLISPVDVVYYQEHAKDLSQVITIQECGHWPMIEAPGELHAVLAGPLGDHNPGSLGNTYP